MMEHDEMQDFPKTTMERAMVGRAYEKGVPINGSFELTPICNMNCDMCYVRLTPEAVAAKGHLRTKDEWLVLAGEMLDAGVLFLLLTGGEPLLYPDFKELYVALQQMGFILTVNTNGTLLDEGWADFFGTYKPRRINITLYGASGDTYDRLCHYRGGFEKTEDAIRLLKERAVDVKVGCSITKTNQDDIEALIDFCRKQEVPLVMDPYMMKAKRERNLEFKDEVRITPEFAAQVSLLQKRIDLGFYKAANQDPASMASVERENYENSRQRFIEYVKRMLAQTIKNQERVDRGELPENSSETLSCLAGHCSFAVNWNGHLKPCVIAPVPEVDVFTKGFVETWKEIHDYCMQLRRAEECIHCPVQHLCSSCPVAELVEEGSYGKAPEYLCQYAKAKQEILTEMERTGKYENE